MSVCYDAEGGGAAKSEQGRRPAGAVLGGGGSDVRPQGEWGGGRRASWGTEKAQRGLERKEEARRRGGGTAAARGTRPVT